jgi:DNA-binding LytR/AlgR family response regulator
LKEYINDVDFVQSEGEFNSLLKAAKLLSEGTIQLIFLDIQMPKISGLEFFKALQHAPPGNFYNGLSSICPGWI